MRRVAQACARAAEAGESAAFTVEDIGPEAVAAALGEGAVACRLGAGFEARETAHPGVWIVKDGGSQRIEVGPAPRAALDRAFEPVRDALGVVARPAAGATSAPTVLTDLLARAARWTPGAPSYAVHLTFLPHTADDLAHLDRALGEGMAKVLSRGNGDCRLEATATPRVWRVRFYNSMGLQVLDGFEVADMPRAARATAADFEDSAARLETIAA